MIRRVLSFLIFIFALSSCATQEKIVYLQNNVIDTQIETIAGGEIRLQPNDIVSIYVSSRNPELASIFNLPRIQQTIGGNTTSIGSANGVIGYTIAPDGNIDFPILGEIEAEGLTKIELADKIRGMIISSNHIKDPIVTVELENLTFSTIGEVTRPGNYRITKDQTTIFDALSLSGDLTIYGLRDRVYLTRRVDNRLVTYKLDLRSKDVYQSPAYFIQQNDVIYVEPNKVRSNQSTVNANTFQSVTFWMSLTSLLTTLTLVFIN